MSFAWPSALLALLAVPLVVGVAWWSRRRRRRAAVRVTSAALVRAAVPGRSRWRRRVPAALLLLGLAVLGIGAARPQATVAVPASSTTILLALDVSGSMCSTDVQPNRLTAAEKAAADFIKAQPGGARIGLVAFAGIAGVLVPPTDDTDVLLAALPNLTTSRGTAIGQAILTSIDAIADIDPAVPPTGVDVTGDPAGNAYAADVIVVLTDGANTQGVEPQTPRSRPPPAGCGSTRSASAPRRRRRWSATARRSATGRAAGGSAAAARSVAVARSAAAAATRWSPTMPRCSRSRRPPAASSTARRTPASCRAPWPTCPARSRSPTSTATSPPGSPASAAS
jgi:Mg-chelatase subunit ChlD